MIKRTLATVLIILTVLPAVILAGSVLFAPYNGFEAFDNAWESSVDAALGNASQTNRLPLSPTAKDILLNSRTAFRYCQLKMRLKQPNTVSLPKASW